MPRGDQRSGGGAQRAGDDRSAAGGGYAVGEVARLARVSVRTLHHYDAIGLLTPQRDAGNGYRRYGPADLGRLLRILAYRALGFDLEAIGGMLDDPELNELDHLERQRDLLEARRERIEGMLRALEATMEARRMGDELDPETMLEAFGDFDPNEHAAEAATRWGDTDAYRESSRRTRRYGKDDWLRIRREGDALVERFADLRAEGVAAREGPAMDAAEAHRQHISRWFYGCSKAMHVGIADMVEGDPRFRDRYDGRVPGLAAYVAAAIRANAERP